MSLNSKQASHTLFRPWVSSPPTLHMAGLFLTSTRSRFAKSPIHRGRGPTIPRGTLSSHLQRAVPSLLERQWFLGSIRGLWWQGGEVEGWGDKCSRRPVRCRMAKAEEETAEVGGEVASNVMFPNSIHPQKHCVPGPRYPASLERRAIQGSLEISFFVKEARALQCPWPYTGRREARGRH